MPAPPSAPGPARHVLVLGGGVAGIECLLGLRDLLGAAVDLALLTDAEEFWYRPLAIGEPFGAGAATHHPIARIAADCGAAVLHGVAEAVDVGAHTVLTRDGERYVYDALVVAVGAVPHLPLGRAMMLDPRPAMLEGLLAEVDAGTTRRVAIVISDGPHWVLPAYELALLLAAHGRDRGMDELEITVVTAEAGPLDLLGPEPSQAVADRLRGAGVRLVCGATAELQEGRRIRVVCGAGHEPFDVDQVVALPELRAPAIDGLPAGPGGFLPVDAHGRVEGAPGVYAAGDCTARPVKQGGLSAQQADAVVEHLAFRAGALEDPQPYRPVLRGRLLTGDAPVYVRHELRSGAPPAEMAGHALWWPPAKIAGRWLAPYLQARDDGAAGLAHPPAHGRPIEVPLDAPQMPVPRHLELLGTEPPVRP
ncbi:NAD(P)/FAD-dependent oxidoreductase [Baekduia soli]|nr:FAD-dependent oxidoreductase [Baekduia soli]